MKSLFEFAKFCNSDAIVTIDADGQFLPNEIQKMIKPISEKNSDIVIGYRFDDKTEMPKYRKIGNKALDMVVATSSTRMVINTRVNGLTI